MHRLYYDLTRNMRREHMCDDSGYVQDERATACLLIRYVLSRRHALQPEMPPIPAHCCPGKSKFGATLGAGPVRPLISMTEHRKNTPRFPPPPICTPCTPTFTRWFPVRGKAAANTCRSAAQCPGHLVAVFPAGQLPGFVKQAR